MSRVYFHSQHGTAELRGAERAHCQITCTHIAWTLLGYSRSQQEPARKFLPANHYALTVARDQADEHRMVETAFAVADLVWTLPDGRAEDSFTVALNTALAIGNDVLKLMAYLHGQCEIHGFIEGPHRAWYAGLIADGLSSGLLRADMGWEACATLLTSRADEPVVTSYSVCRQFPNPDQAGWVDENEGDDFYSLPDAERWRLGLEALRAAEKPTEWSPGKFADGHFGHGITAMDIRAAAK